MHQLSQLYDALIFKGKPKTIEIQQVCDILRNV